MNEIVVSEIQIIPVKPKDGLVGFASCVINGQLYIGNIAIYSRPDGNDFRLAYPKNLTEWEANQLRASNKQRCRRNNQKADCGEIPRNLLQADKNLKMWRGSEN